MRAMRRKDRLVTDANEIQEIIRRGKTCRIAVVNDDVPRMISLNYDSSSLENGTLELSFRCNFSDTNMDIFKKNNAVCFEISHDDGVHIDTEPEKSTLYYASVIGNGKVVFSEESVATAEIPVANQFDIDKAKIIINQSKTCHIAMSDDGVPYIVPLSHGSNFTNDNTLELYFHSAVEGRKIDILKKNNKVYFEVESAGMDNQLFVSRYMLELPSKETLTKFIMGEIVNSKL